jgi:probable aminopeptidase NPEPL1
MNLNRESAINASPLTFSQTSLSRPTETIVVGRKASLTVPTISTVLGYETNSQERVTIGHMLNSIKESGKASSFLTNGDKVTIQILPALDKITRNNHPFSPHTITESLSSGLSGKTLTSSESVQIHFIDEDMQEFIGPVAASVARALPLYNSKSKKKEDSPKDETLSSSGGVTVSFSNKEGTLLASDDNEEHSHLHSAQSVADGVRLAARLVDMPPAELNPETYAQECQRIVQELVNEGGGGDQVTYEEIVGDDLKTQGYGGIFGVGMAAQVEPRMIVMTYTPEDYRKDMEHIALCGKGVVYDTGGLSLKSKAGMCGMKHDMGGSAGVLGGFQAAVQLKASKKVTLILAIVENAIGPDAVRNDDILTMKSGKTVEINNTDAEGRLVLADCVSHASNVVEGVDVILDMATLTGAQLVCTGKKHAGILAKTTKIEERIMKCGLKSGDLVYPMLYAPELLKSEFSSVVADMKNSVKDRGNAQASCAGHFIESHIDPTYKGDWVSLIISCVLIYICFKINLCIVSFN